MLTLLLTSFLSYWPYFASAASISGDGDSGSEIATVGWQSSSRTRGTWSLLMSCLITLTLCVYTAIHPNIPKQGSSYSDFLKGRTKWVFVGILAPELVVYTAWRQWTSARHLKNELTRSKDERAILMDSSGPSFLGNWSMLHSFFVEMGGYVIERKGEKNVTLTAKGVIRMVELGYKLPRLSEADIQDRSKADPITKVITCAQAGYMIAEVISRRAADLPITMLEINTLGHAVCALGMFTFWFRKPLNIEIPVLIDEGWLNKQQERITQQTQGFWSPAFWKRPREHQAKLHRYADSLLLDNVAIREDILFLVFLERLREHKLFDHIVQAKPQEPLRTEIRPGLPALNEPWKSTDVVLTIAGFDLSDLEDLPNNIRSVIESTQLWPLLVTSIYHCSDNLESLWPSHATTLCLGEALQVYLTLDDVVKWDRAWNSFVAAGSLESPEAWSEWKADFDSQAQASQYTCFRAQNWPSDTGKLNSRHRLLGISILGLATGFYGGLHLLLWFAYFPTKAERDLWRICALIIAVSGIIAGYLVLIVSDEHDPLPRYLKPMMWPFQQAILGITVLSRPDKVVKVSAQLTLLAACVVGPCYVAARAYIIIECFLSLRRLPVDAYKVPLWSQFWPHV